MDKDLINILIERIDDLEARLSELEDDHISLLLRNCVCNNDGGDNSSCESIMHYCICKSLGKCTFDCRAKTFDINGHCCVCGDESVEWCRAHTLGRMYDVSLQDSVELEINNNKHEVIKNYNPKRYIKHFLSRLK